MLSEIVFIVFVIAIAISGAVIEKLLELNIDCDSDNDSEFWKLRRMPPNLRLYLDTDKYNSGN